MRIEDRPDPVGSAGTRAAEIEQASSSKSRGAGSFSRAGGDSVQLSGASLVLQSYHTTRAAKLDQLSHAIQNGSYQSNASRISQALVNETIGRSRNEAA